MKARWMWIILAAMACMFVGMYLATNADTQDDAVAVVAQQSGYTEASDPLEEYRRQREAARSNEQQQLQDIAHSSDTEAEIIALAKERLLEISERASLETAVEGNLRLRSFDAVASVNAHCAYVYVRAEILTAQQTSIISEVICQETGFANDNIKIIPVNYGNF